MINYNEKEFIRAELHALVEEYTGLCEARHTANLTRKLHEFVADLIDNAPCSDELVPLVRKEVLMQRKLAGEWNTAYYDETGPCLRSKIEALDAYYTKISGEVYGEGNWRNIR